MNKDALNERLKVIANEKSTTQNKIWKQLLLERFLARLAASSYQDKFIFKGGLLLAQYINISRETSDIDLLMTKIKSETQNIERIFKEITGINLDDGFEFSYEAVVELDQPHMDYAGFRVTLAAKYDGMRDNIQIDIAVGDVVLPMEMSFINFEYKGKPIFAGEISLYVYPPESIFSEKLETIVSKGMVNSRMKDFHDLLLMIREAGLLNPEILNDAVNATFKRRGTSAVKSIAVDTQNMQALWSSHLRGLGAYREKLDLPEEMKDVVAEINAWLEMNLQIP